MSWLDGLVDESEAMSQIQRLDTTSDQLAPGFFTGALDVIGPGLVRGGIEGVGTVEALLTQGAGNLSAMNLTLGDVMGGGQGASPIDEEESAAIKQRVDVIGSSVAEATIDLRPNPASVGMAGQIIGEAAAILPRTIAGAVAAGPLGGAIAAGAPAGLSGKYVAMEEGVDEATATLKGLVDATTIGVGAVLPAAKFVGPALGDFAIAVGANVGLGVGGRGLTGKLLEDAGYTAQAAQYKAFDGTAIAVDAILGAAFFGIGRASMRRPTTEQVQAALTENNAQHFDTGTAPGAATTPAAAVAHQDALRAAVEQISRGEPVTLPESIHAAEFLRSADEFQPVAPARQEIMASARMDVEPTFRAELEQQAAGIVPNVKDLKAELSTLQRTIDGLDSTFRERAKAFQEQGQPRKKAEASARQEIAAEREQITRRQAAITESLDTNRSAEQARADLAALDRGEAPKALDERVAARADEVAKGFERKPLADSVSKAGPEMSLIQVARQEIARIVDELERLEARPAPAKLDIGQPAARAASEAPAAQQAATGTSEAGATRAPDQPGQPAAGDDMAGDPSIRVADEIMARVDDIQVPTGATDVDGNPVTVSARQLLAEADADIARAKQDANGFAAAAACFLQRGIK